MNAPLNALMDNVLAWKLGEVADAAVQAPAGDLIDRGLVLLRLLNEAGFELRPSESKT